MSDRKLPPVRSGRDWHPGGQRPPNNQTDDEQAAKIAANLGTRGTARTADMSQDRAMWVEIHIAADMSGTGVEARAADDPEGHLAMMTPAELGLSEHLTYEICSWQRWFDEVVYLLGLEERFEALGVKFDEVGRELAERVAVELGPDPRVVYGPQGGWSLVIGHGQAIVVQTGRFT